MQSSTSTDPARASAHSIAFAIANTRFCYWGGCASLRFGSLKVSTAGMQPVCRQCYHMYRCYHDLASTLGSVGRSMRGTCHSVPIQSKQHQISCECTVHATTSQTTAYCWALVKRYASAGSACMHDTYWKDNEGICQLCPHQLNKNRPRDVWHVLSIHHKPSPTRPCAGCIEVCPLTT